MVKKDFSKIGRFNSAAQYIRSQKKVSLVKLATYFNLSTEYASRELKGLLEFFPDISFDGKYFYVIDFGNENNQLTNPEPKQKQEAPS